MNRLRLLFCGAMVLGSLLLVAPARAVPPPPPVGACYSYNWSVFLAPTNTAPRVSCSVSHNAKTVATGTLLPGTTPETAFSEANRERMRLNCFAALKRNVGTGWVRYAQAAFSLALFRPTDAEWAAGARWYRCDAVLPGVGRLFALPLSNPFVGTAALTTRTRACMTAAPDIRRVSCKERHAFRSVGTFAVASTTYPSATAWRGAAVRRCPQLVTTSQFGYSFPTRAEFQLGDKLVTCYDHTTG